MLLKSSYCLFKIAICKRQVLVVTSILAGGISEGEPFIPSTPESTAEPVLGIVNTAVAKAQETIAFFQAHFFNTAL